MKPKKTIGIAAVAITMLVLVALAFKFNVPKRSEHFLAQAHENMSDDLVEKRIRSEFSHRAALIRMLQARGMTYERFRRQVKQEVEANATKH